MYFFLLEKVYGYDDITKWKNQYEIIVHEEEGEQTQDMDTD